MVAVGAMVTATQILPLDTIVQTLRNHLPSSKQSLLKSNEQALRRGAVLVESIDVRQ
jgi:hypothetical protein